MARETAEQRQVREYAARKIRERQERLGANQPVTLKQLQEEERLENARLKEERERPRKEAEMLKKAREIASRRVEKESLLNEEDENLFIDPEMPQVLYGQKEFTEYMESEARKFVAATPDYWPGPVTESCPMGTNFHAMGDYLDRNGVGKIISAKMWKQAYDKLKSVGALVERPAPKPQPEPIAERVQPVSVPVDDGSEVGIDPLTGLSVRKTRREIELMSSDDYRRFHAGRIKTNFAEVLQRP